MDEFPRIRETSEMQKLDLPNLKVLIVGDSLTVTHKRTHSQSIITVKQLESWLVRRLREELTPFYAPKGGK